MNNWSEAEHCVQRFSNEIKREEQRKKEMNCHSGVHRLSLFFSLSIEVTISPFVNFNHVVAVNTASIVRNCAAFLFELCFYFWIWWMRVCVRASLFMFHSFGRDAIQPDKSTHKQAHNNNNHKKQLIWQKRKKMPKMARIWFNCQNTLKMMP